MEDIAEVLRAAALDLTRTLDPEAVLEILLERIARIVPYDTANVMLIEDETHVCLQAVRGYDRFGDPALTRHARFEIATHPILSALIASRRPILIPDTREHPGWQHHEGGRHVRNWIGVPLIAEGRVIGLYALDKTEPGFFTEAHVRLVEAMAPHAALAITNARVFEEIQRSEERFRALVENSSDAVSLMDAKGTITYVSQAAVQILGKPVEAQVGRNAFETIHPDDIPACRDAFAKCLTHPGLRILTELRVRHRDGSWRVVDAVGVNRLHDPAVGAIVVNYRDVTERREAERRIEALNRDLQRQVEEFQTLLDVIPIGIAVARDPECRRILPNAWMRRLLDLERGVNSSYTPGDGDRPPSTELWRDGKPIPTPDLPMQRAAARGVEVVDEEMELVREGRKVATIVGYAAPLFDESGRPRGAIGAALDITERKQAEEQVRTLAYQDTLTGLPNRLLFHDRLALGIAQAHRHGQRLAVLFVDLDRLKAVNDSIGHAAGDHVIRTVGTRLRAAVREGDTVARLGGDEFILLLPDVGQAVDAAKVADKVLESLREPLLVEGRELVVTASVGISLYPDDGKDAESLVKNADAAMYGAKERGRDTYQIYTKALNASAVEQLALESRFRKALVQDELVLHYQPIVDLATGDLHAVEALLRWRHPELGLIRPADFIPLAEITGLIVPIGLWVLRTACAQARAWQSIGRADLKVAVNLSVRQFQQADLAAQVERALSETGLAASQLVLEITETHAMLDAEATARALYDLRRLGVGLAIDDFGTGYSSLSYLKRFPIDSLKIDTSFIRDIPGDSDDTAIAAAVIQLAHTLKLQVVAEGVETEDQRAFLVSRGCDRAQGHLFCHPLPAAECTELIGGAPAWQERLKPETAAHTWPGPGSRSRG
jgi:diguanylate cyclase (GGDEF)-like protein/PAS domain S-box-containing protein